MAFFEKKVQKDTSATPCFRIAVPVSDVVGLCLIFVSVFALQIYNNTSKSNKICIFIVQLF